MVQIEVLVKNKDTGLERTLTYKSYLDLVSQYELIGQIDESGNLIPGNPNLQTRHQYKKTENVVANAASVGQEITLIPEMEEIPIMEKYEEQIQEIQNENVSRETKRRGRPKTIVA